MPIGSPTGRCGGGNCSVEGLSFQVIPICIKLAEITSTTPNAPKHNSRMGTEARACNSSTMGCLTPVQSQPDALREIQARRTYIAKLQNCKTNNHHQQQPKQQNTQNNNNNKKSKNKQKTKNQKPNQMKEMQTGAL